MINIVKIEDSERKAAIARRILAALPDWFGIPEYAENYVKESRKMPFWAAFPESEEPGCDSRTNGLTAGTNDGPDTTVSALGFLALKETSPYTAEIYVMGILPEYHRQGIGRQLYAAFLDFAREQGYCFLQVKTVQEGHYEEYDRTNRFYRALGFRELECFPTLWDEWNPCQVLVATIPEDDHAKQNAPARRNEEIYVE